MHSSIPSDQDVSAETPDISVILRKRSQGNYTSIQQTENVTVKRLRRIADEINDYDQMGFDLFLFLAAQRTGGGINLFGEVRRPSLPKILPLPKKLILPVPPNPKGKKRPPQSSPV